MAATPTPPELILALDVKERDQGLRLLKRLGKSVRWVKIGLGLFTQYGPAIIEEVAGLGYRIFLDLKLHDIPPTVAAAIESLSPYPIELLTLHAAGGEEMLQSAVAARDQCAQKTKLLGVTVLTSLDVAALATIGVHGTPAAHVTRLATLALHSRLDGLVCSAQELRTLRARFGPAPLLVTPGIRPSGALTHEQKRTATPAEATRDGATHIVVGRPILSAPDPIRAVDSIVNEMNQ